MENFFEKYIQSVVLKFSHKETSEMGYRTDFEILLKAVFESIKVQRINHDAKAEKGNKPDFVVLKYDIPILYIEAKDIGVSLDKVEKSEQMARYFGYANLILTDYLEFRFYRNGVRYEEPIKIADYDIKNRTILPIPENYEHVTKSLVEFAQTYKELIRSGEHLAKIMGGKAQRIRDNVRQFIFFESNKSVGLVRVYETIKKLLVHDLTSDAFSDMYAQTLVYGLFVARYHDDKEGNFSRQKARELVPASNPLLRHFFDHIVGPDFDKRLEYIVNELCEVFSHADVRDLMNQYYKKDLWGETHESPDPVIHFYEDFLKEYDQELRKKMGAFYTPLPVVRFIVNAVDYVLENEFGLSQGLANTSKIKETHKVQILDPAVGTGTFLTEVIKNIHSKFKGQEGRWPDYVYHDLLPRLYGFELMMAPYTIAHLKMSMVLKESGFKYFNKARLGIYLTNSLEGVTTQKDLFNAFGFAESIAEESKEASKIKNEKPIMVVVGNPPYSGVSMNKQYTDNSVYKVEPGGKQKLKERKNWLDDDYVKFIRLAESLIEKKHEGIIGMITSHGYIDNPTFRGMRWHLRKTFDKIYVLDLHGNNNKKETSPDGSKDENVFNIKTGVAIILGIKKQCDTENKKLATIFKADIYGTRKIKFGKLEKESINSIKWNKLPEETEIWRIEGKGKYEYQKGFSAEEIFIKNTTGVVTMGDSFIVDENRDVLNRRMNEFLYNDISEIELKNKYGLGKNYAKWIVSNKKKIENTEDKIIPFAYRPFDIKYTYFDNNLVWRTRADVMQNFLISNNVGLVLMRQATDDASYNHVIVSKNIVDNRFMYSGKGITLQMPLYVYDKDGLKTANLKKEIVDKIEKMVGETTPENILDYIYAVLHSPKYREKYKEFLKIDFPRVPYPEDKKEFSRLVKLGSELRELHLMESNKLNKIITTYSETGDNEVKKVGYENGKVFINEKQFFGNVPEIVWNFYIGGYQPAQKWLKDRKGHKLTNADIEHYQKIVVVLTETDKIMKLIDG